VKADPASQRRLLDLAGLDAELARATYRRAHLPEQAEVEKAETEQRTRRDAVVRAETAVADLERDLAKLDKEVEQVRTRETRDRTLIDGGSVSAKQMTDLEHELDTLGRRRAVLEDEQLEVMERHEAASTDLRHEQDALAGTQRTLEDAVERRDGVLGDIEVVETRRGEERAALSAQLPADLVALYDTIRSRGAIGAGELVGNRCGACRLEIDRSELGRVNAAAPDDVVRCDQCGAILVRGTK
jgi:uncharacterized protein